MVASEMFSKLLGGPPRFGNSEIGDVSKQLVMLVVLRSKFSKNFGRFRFHRVHV